MKTNANCQHCGKEMYLKPFRLGQSERHYCSNECYQKARYGEKEEVRCRVCNKLITSTAGSKRAKYCSRSCSNKGRVGISYKQGQPQSNDIVLKRNKRRLIDAFGEVCSECGIGPEWNEKPLCLQVDHINGVRSDNRIENLRLLCPNCHTQTETYAGKNRRDGRTVLPLS